MRIRRTTQKEFKVFQDEFNKWAKVFGLTRYEVFFTLEPETDCFASIRVDESGKIAVVNLTSELEEEHTKIKEFNPKSHAKHEAIHLLLTRLSWLGLSRCVQADEIHDEEESLVRLLCKLL